MIKLKLKILKGEFTIHKFSSNEHTPEDVSKSEFYWIGKTDEELSIVCDSNIFLNSVEKNDSWSIIRLDSILEFTLVGSRIFQLF